MFGWDDAAAMVLKLIDRAIPDPEAKARAAFELAKMRDTQEARELDAELRRAQMQADVNKAEASSADPFTSRWRPSVGYVCALGLFYAAILEPCIRLFATIAGTPAVLPAVDTTLTLQLLFGLLGLGGMRMHEKVKGVS